MLNYMKLLFLFSLCFLLVCQSTQQPMTEKQRTEIRETINNLFDGLLSSIEEVDVDRKYSYWSDVYNVGFLNNDDFYPSLDSLMSDFRIGFSQLASQKVNVKEKRIAVLAPNVAVLTAYGDFTAIGKDNSTYESPYVWTFVLTKVEDDWKIVHNHQSFPKVIRVESDLNRIGYKLLRTDKINEAIDVFKLNVKFFPESSNVYDSLGEAYMKKGDAKLAIKNYEKSLELNPNNNNAIEMLKKLKQK